MPTAATVTCPRSPRSPQGALGGDIEAADTGTVTAHTRTLAVTRPCEITVAFRSHAGSGRFSSVSTAA